MGTFINIDIDHKQLTPALSEQLVSLCPVDIFTLDSQRLQVRSEQEDECILCERCLDAAPAGALIIRKSYKDAVLISRGEAQ